MKSFKLSLVRKVKWCPSHAPGHKVWDSRSLGNLRRVTCMKLSHCNQIISVSIKESEDFDWHHCQPAVPMMSKPNGAICLSEQSFLLTDACRSFTKEMISTHAHVCARRHICCTHTKINVSKRSDTFVSVSVPFFFFYFFWKASDENKIISRMEILTFCQQQKQETRQWWTQETLFSYGHTCTVKLTRTVRIHTHPQNCSIQFYKTKSVSVSTTVPL